MKIKKIKSKHSYKNVEIREATVKDALTAERATGKPEGIEYLSALIAEVAIFDGKKKTVEDLSDLPLSVFLELAPLVGVLPQEVLDKQLSSLPENQA